MSESNALLSVKGLGVEIQVEDHWRRIVKDVSFELAPGEAVGIVGESGSGKSVTARSIMRMLPAKSRVEGSITFDGQDVLTFGRRRLRGFRTHEIGMIYQDPRSHVNPVRTVGDFLLEGVRHLPKSERMDRAVGALRDVGIVDAERRMRQYPHQLSGGLLQRVMIAAAIMPDPKLILADEPSTALDVTTQSEVMAVLNEARASRGLAMVFITHDLELAAAMTDRLAVMYAGTIVESGTTAQVHTESTHPYTLGLMASQPSAQRGARLYSIPGRPVAAYEVAQGCVFASRCEFVQERCLEKAPEPRPVLGTTVRCHRADEAYIRDAFAKGSVS